MKRIRSPSRELWMTYFSCIHYVCVWPWPLTIFSKFGSRDPDVVMDIFAYLESYRRFRFWHMRPKKCRVSGQVARGPALPWQPFSKKEKRQIYLPRIITPWSKKNKETILKLARSRLSVKQKAIYAGRQHCQYYYTNIRRKINSNKTWKWWNTTHPTTHLSKHRNKVMNILHHSLESNPHVSP